MTEWKTVKLSDLGEIVGGATPSTSREEYYNGDIPWLTPKDLAGYQYRYIGKGERNITKAGLESCSAKIMPKNTVLFTSRAPIGYVAIAKNDICTNQGFKSIVPNDQTDYLFLYYLLKYNKDKIEAMGSGTTFKEVSGFTMCEIEVKVPQTKDIQGKIAQVLDSIDSKIEKNRQINDNLFQQLQAIYQMMFGEASQNGEQGGRLSDICAYSQRRIAVSSLSRESYYSTENMLPGKAGAVAASSLPSIAQTTGCMPGDVLISNIRPYFKKIVYSQSECGCSTDVLCFAPKSPDFSLFLFSTLYDDHFFDYMVAGSKGTKMPRGDKQQIMAYPVVLPSAAQLAGFNAVAQPILSKIEIGNQENKRLASMRDALLPKLMTGEIDVSSITA